MDTANGKVTSMAFFHGVSISVYVFQWNTLEFHGMLCRNYDDMGFEDMKRKSTSTTSTQRKWLLKAYYKFPPTFLYISRKLGSTQMRVSLYSGYLPVLARTLGHQKQPGFGRCELLWSLIWFSIKSEISIKKGEFFCSRKSWNWIISIQS